MTGDCGHTKKVLSQEGTYDGTREMLQLGKCFLDWYEDLNSTPKPSAKGVSIMPVLGK